MDITSFYTMQAPATGVKDTTANAAAGVTGTPTTNFLDFLLANFVQNAETGESTPTPQADQPLQSDHPLMDGDVDMAEMLAVNPEIREEIEHWMLDPNSKLSQVLALNQKALDEAIAPATDGIITTANVEAGSPRLLQALLVDEKTGEKISSDVLMARLQKILDKIEKLTSGPEAPGLVLTNLTPQEITDLKVKIKNFISQNTHRVLTEEERKQIVDEISLTLIQLISPAAQAQVHAQAFGSTTKINVTATTDSTDPIENIPTKVNTLAPGVPAAADAPEVSPGVFEDGEDGSQKNGTTFANILKDFSGKKSVSANVANNNVAVPPGVKPDLSVLQGWPFNISGSIFSPAIAPYDEYAAQNPALTITGPGSLTNLVTQAHSASQPHPATQMVAATLTKGAASGETKNITLQLDPPELGRVEVRMSFGKDKSVKAVLLAEKPETLAMLQRDAHALERALSATGLEADGSLSFELAHEGYNFNQQGQGNGSNGYASRDSGTEDIIETKMTWHVDPETGHMRYNILA